MANLKISGVTSEDARIKIMDDDVYIGYKDISTGAYSVVFPDQRPAVNPDDDFTGDNDDPPDSTKWQVISGDPTIQSNKLSMTHDSSEGNVEQIMSRFVLTGDFSINMRADQTAVPESNYTQLDLRVTSLDLLNGGAILIRTQSDSSSGAYIVTYKITNGVWAEIDETYMGHSFFNAGVGINRSGSAFATTRSTGGGWSVNSGHDFTGITDDVKVTIASRHTSVLPAVTHLVDSFEMVSGETVVSGTWPVHIYGVSDNTDQTIGYANIPSIETNDAVDIIEYPYNF